MMNKKIILASASPRRKDLLSKTGLVFDVIPSNYEENMTLALEPKELVIRLSEGKATDVASNLENAIVIGADTFIFYDGKILGKPHTKEKAKEMLEMLNGQTHSVFTGFTVIDTTSNKKISEALEAKVTFKKLSKEEIYDYISTGEPLERAGAYAIQGIGKKLVERFEGDYDGIIGLPVGPLLKVLKNFGVGVPQG